MFVNREEELVAFERFWQSDRAEFFVLYGRRRVGKTALLRRFSEGKKAHLLPRQSVEGNG